jgi:hypothetical protein
MASLRSDVRSVVDRLCADHGCTARMTRSGHWRVDRPGQRSLTFSGSPSDHRALKNIHGELRRHWGIDLT